MPPNTTWNQVAPHQAILGTAVFSALRWFVDPYDPDLIYVLDFRGVKVSPEGGPNLVFRSRDDNYGDGGWQASDLVFGGTGHAVLQGKAADAILIRNGGRMLHDGFRCHVVFGAQFNRVAGAS